MALSLQTNVSTLIARQNLYLATQALQENQERLASGYRLSSAADDPAGLAQVSRFTAQIRGQNEGLQNAQNGISLVQTALGGTEEIISGLQHIREKAVQAANASYSVEDRLQLDAEYQNVLKEIDRIARSTTFNGQKVLEGSVGSAGFLVGADPGPANLINVALDQSLETNQIGAQVLDDLALGNQQVSISPSEGKSADQIISSQEIGNTLAPDELVVNNTPLNTKNAANDTAQGEGQSSAFALSAAINTKAENAAFTVNAAPQTTTATSQNPTVDGEGNGTYTLAINGEAVISNQDVSANPITAEQAAERINQATETTGVSAQTTSEGLLELNAEAGRSIKIQEINTDTAGKIGSAFFGNSNGAIPAATSNGAAAETTEIRGKVQLSSLVGIRVEDTTTNSGAPGPDVASFAGQTVGEGGSADTEPKELDTSSVRSIEEARKAIARIDTAIEDVNRFRSELGSAQNRLDSAASYLQTSTMSLTAARSRIQDADIAKEAAEMARNKIWRDTAASVLAQANQDWQVALQLLDAF